MDNKKILGTINPDNFKIWIKQAFQETGITSVEFLKDDKKVTKAAENLYKRIPLFPFRAAIKVVVGKKGFIGIVFKIRDKMLHENSLDFSWINVDYLKKWFDEN